MPDVGSVERPLGLRLLETAVRGIRAVQYGLGAVQLSLRHRIAFRYRFERRPDAALPARLVRTATDSSRAAATPARGRAMPRARPPSEGR